MPEINDLPPTPGAINSDLLATKKGATDYRASIGQLAETVLSNLTPEQAMALVQQVATNNSGLNSNFLQGATRAFFQNASNLNAGTVSVDRLPPMGSVVETGGSAWATRVYLPEFLLGSRVLVQFGQTLPLNRNTSRLITFPVPFVSGYGSSNTPLFMVSPLCTTDHPASAEQRIEIDVRTYDLRLSLAQIAAIRTTGSGTDAASGMWLAIGKY